MSSKRCQHEMSAPPSFVHHSQEAIFASRRYAWGPCNWLAVVACALLFQPYDGSTAESRARAADTVYVNGRIYTVAGATKWADSVAISRGRFVAVGERVDVEKMAGKGTRTIDLQGSMVLPGLHDAHSHIELVGKQWTYWCQIENDAGPSEFVAALRECTESMSPDEWLVASAYAPQMFPDGRADRSYLDEYFPNRPVYIVEHSWHHGIANTAALKLAGIDASTPDPEHGVLVRDRNGRLTGELLEHATWLVKQHIPQASPRDLRKAIEWVIGQHSRYGVTSVQDAGTARPVLKQLRAIDSKEGLPLRIMAHLMWQHVGIGDASKEEMERLIQERQRYKTVNVDPNFVKIVLDGSPMPPHSNHADLNTSGEIPAEKLLVEPIDLNAALVRFDREGIKAKIHCVGTGAARAALNAIEAARRSNGESGIYHEVAHSVWYSSSDLPRVAELKAVAEMSPAIWHHGWPGMEEAFAFRRMYDQGTLMTAGTDWVILPNPNLLPALEGMLTREGHSIDLEAGIRILTINGARSVGKAEEFGSIEVGKSADMVVLSQNLFDIPQDEISEVKVMMTVFRGDVVFEDGELSR